MSIETLLDELASEQNAFLNGDISIDEIKPLTDEQFELLMSYDLGGK